MHDGLIILRMKKEHRITFRDHDHPHWNSQMSLFANFILFNTSLFQICQSYSRSQLSIFQFSSCILTSMILPWTWQPCSSLLARSQPSRLSRVTNPNPFEPRSFITISTFTTRPYLQSNHKQPCICSELFMSLSQFLFHHSNLRSEHVGQVDFPEGERDVGHVDAVVCELLGLLRLRLHGDWNRWTGIRRQLSDSARKDDLI